MSIRTVARVCQPARRAILVLALSIGITAARAGVHEPSIDVTFPDQIAGLSFVGSTSFPKKALGVSIAYERGPVRGSVYIYDAGASSIPTDLDAQLMRKHFAQVLAEVQKTVTVGQATSVTWFGSEGQVTSEAGCGPQFLWREFEWVLPDVGALNSFTYLTGFRGQFVKLRVSYRKGTPEGKAQVERFVRELRHVLGGCRA